MKTSLFAVKVPLVEEIMLVGMASKALLLVLVPVDFKGPCVVLVVLLLSGPIVVLVLFVAPSAADVLRPGALGSPELEVLVVLVESVLEVFVVLVGSVLEVFVVFGPAPLSAVLVVLLTSEVLAVFVPSAAGVVFVLLAAAAFALLLDALPPRPPGSKLMRTRRLIIKHPSGESQTFLPRPRPASC
jgi:hypothetical protein